MAELIAMGDFITPSEKRAAAHLKNLPDDWLVICNKEIVLPSGRTYEMDFVIVGSHAVFVIDEKSWHGKIYGNENVWVLSGAETRYSPLQKLGHISRQLAGSLRKAVPYLYNLPPAVHFVHGAALLSADFLEFRVNDPRVPRHVLRLADALSSLPHLDSEYRDTDLSLCRAKLRQVLTDLRDRPQHPKTINTYEVVEFLGTDVSSVRSYDAKHASGKRRLIRLYPVDPVEGATDALLRGYDAASAAADLGVAPAVDPYFWWNDNRYLVVPFHVPGGTPLCSAPGEAPPSDPQPVLELVQAAFSAIRQLHESGLIHRALNPRCIFRVRGGSDVQFTDFGFARVDERASIGDHLDELDFRDPYLAPECRIGFGLGERATDVYSLALSLCSYLSGTEPLEAVPEWVESSMREVTRLWPVDVADDIVSLLRLCASEEPRLRPRAQTVADKAAKVLEALRRAAPAETPETLGDGQYRVIRKLGEGASAVAWLVEDTCYGGQYVLKRIKNPEAAQRFAGREFQSLQDLNHLSLPKVYDVRQPQDDFHLKLRFIPGVELAHCMADYRNDRDRLLRLALPLLDVLDYLEQQSITHRDISPRNIIIPEDRNAPPVLIDFGLAKSRDDLRPGAAGTPMYWAPEAAAGRGSATSDVYSLAVILFEVATGSLPFEMPDGIPDKSTRIEPPAEAIRTVGRPLLDCLLRAMAPEPDRFQSASSFREALLEAARQRTEAPTPDGEELCLDWVWWIRGLYRDSAGGNADNRGLDSDFARDTYVPTLLDTALLPDVVNRRRKLVFLTGNPGDGKTAFLEMVRAKVEQLQDTTVNADRYGWRAQSGRGRFEAVYDASESRGPESSDAVLTRVMAPFGGPDAPDWFDVPVTLIAINDGRLQEFLETYAADFGWLRDRLDEQMFGDGQGVDEIAIVDLKRRTLTSTPDEHGSLFRSMAAKVLGAEAWNNCAHCKARQSCHIKFNADSLRDPHIAQRFETLLLTQHWRRERRATIRDVRSAFSYVLTGNMTCDDVHAEERSRVRSENASRRRYYHAAFNLAGVKDELLSEMSVLDPAARPHARLDRFLHFHRAEDRRDALAALFRPVHGRSALPDEGLQDVDWHAAMKRRLYFERASGELPAALQRWDLPGDRSLNLPYLFLEHFMDALLGVTPAEKVRDRLLAGISRAEGIPAQAARNRLSLSLSRNAKEELTVIRQIDANQFECRATSAPHCEYVENIPEALELTYVPQGITLPVTLDMFEILMRMSEGYTPGSIEFSPFLVELAEFKARLVRLGVSEVLLLEGRSRLHRVATQDRRIVYRGAI